MKTFRTVHLFLFCASLLFTGCSCNPEKLIEWIASSDMFKGTEEVRAIGGFSRIESHFNKDISGDSSKIELRLYNGTHPELYENEANIARECAKVYIEATESEDYQQIEVFIIKTDDIDPHKAIYQSQYLFDVSNLAEDEASPVGS